MVTQNTNLPNLPNLANLPNKISLGSINADYLTASRHTQRDTKKREKLSFLSSVPLDVLFSNEYLSDLASLYELYDVVPDPNNLPWSEIV